MIMIRGIKVAILTLLGITMTLVPFDLAFSQPSDTNSTGPMSTAGGSNQLVITLQPGERGWDPDRGPGSFPIDLNGLIETEDRTDLSFYTTWLDPTFGNMRECVSANIFGNILLIGCPQFIEEGAVLTIVINSPNPLVL
jgi:hypothetical protein